VPPHVDSRCLRRGIDAEAISLRLTDRRFVMSSASVTQVCRGCYSVSRIVILSADGTNSEVHLLALAPVESFDLNDISAANHMSSR
jgi:hypothetical protein